MILPYRFTRIQGFGFTKEGHRLCQQKRRTMFKDKPKAKLLGQTNLSQIPWIWIQEAMRQAPCPNILQLSNHRNLQLLHQILLETMLQGPLWNQMLQRQKPNVMRKKGHPTIQNHQVG